MYPRTLGLTVMQPGPKPGTVMDSAATLGWRAILPGEVVASTTPHAAAINIQDRPILTQANLPAQPLPPLPTPPPAVVSRPSVPFVPGQPTADSGMPQVAAPVQTSGARLLPTDVAPQAPTMPIVPPAGPASVDPAPNALVVAAPVVSTSGGQVMPATGGGSLPADGGGTPMNQPAVTADVGSFSMSPALLLLLVAGAYFLTRKGGR